jgi:hypothetical protein
LSGQAFDEFWQRSRWRSGAVEVGAALPGDSQDDVERMALFVGSE